MMSGTWFDIFLVQLLKITRSLKCLGHLLVSHLGDSSVVRSTCSSYNRPVLDSLIAAYNYSFKGSKVLL